MSPKQFITYEPKTLSDQSIVLNVLVHGPQKTLRLVCATEDTAHRIMSFLGAEIDGLCLLDIEEV